jgi:hypothetical protein
MAYKSPMDDLPDEHMRMVGIISAHWEWIELILERAIAEIMEHPFPRVALLTNSISFYTKCDLILVYARVYEESHPDIWKQFTAAIIGLKTAYRGRNEFVHGTWKKDSATKVWGKAEVRTKGGKLTISDEEIPIKRMEKVAQDIWDAGTNFTLLCQMQGVTFA